MPRLPKKVASLDTETTGLDLYHSCRPFLFTLCELNQAPLYWEWFVDPVTRQPVIPPEDIEELIERINDYDEIVGQNIKFDIQAALSISPKLAEVILSKTLNDTLFAGHLIASAEPHSLDVLSIRYLRHDIGPLEATLERACKEARTLAKRDYPTWLLAREGLPGMPSVSGGSAKDKDEKPWKNDAWLPRAIAKARKYPEDHPWWTVCSNYANGDSQVTIAIWEVQQKILEERKLWNVYWERRKLIPIVVNMESRGVTYSGNRLHQLKTDFVNESVQLEKECIELSKGKLDKLPKSGTSNAVKALFEEWKLPVVSWTDKGNPSYDKKALEVYKNTLPVGSPAQQFITRLITKRKRDTSISYMVSYLDFGIRIVTKGRVDGEFFILHPSLNPTGQVTLRWSSKNPNEQNISKEGYEGAKSVRWCFGPAPGREWWSLDYQNLELRIPAYEAGETDMINLFERPNDPPFFGSNHLMAFSILHPLEWAEHGVKVKEIYGDTLYQWTKNGNFAVQYGAMEGSGTADAAYHVEGGQTLIKEKFTQIALLNDRMIETANKNGYVETMYDKDVGGAYPIQTPKSIGKWGNEYLSPTIPLSYHTQSTAMWVMGKAMRRVDNFLTQWNAANKMRIDLEAFMKRLKTAGAFITMQIHDELVVDLPKGKEARTNLPVVLEVKRLMEKSGEDIGVPLGVDFKLHLNNWADKDKF